MRAPDARPKTMTTVFSRAVFYYYYFASFCAPLVASLRGNAEKAPVLEAAGRKCPLLNASATVRPRDLGERRRTESGRVHRSRAIDLERVPKGRKKKLMALFYYCFYSVLPIPICLGISSFFSLLLFSAAAGRIRREKSVSVRFQISLLQYFSVLFRLFLRAEPYRSLQMKREPTNNKSISNNAKSCTKATENLSLFFLVS